MAGFTVVANLFTTIDNVLNTMVSSNVATLIEDASPIVGICLTIKFLTQGVFMMLSPNGGEPLSEVITSYVKVIMILSFATAGGIYQTDLISIAETLPDSVATTLQSLNNTSYTGIAGIIDGGITDCINAIKTEFDAAGVMSADGLMSLAIGSILFIVTIIIGGLGAGFILMAKVLLSVTLCFGPIAIFCLCWKPVKGIFDKWMGSVINYCLVVIMVALVFGLLMTLFTNMIDGFINGAGVYDALSTVIGLCLLAAVAVLVLFQVPALAASFGSGVQAHIGEAARGAISSFGGLSPASGIQKALGGAAGGSGGSGSGGGGSSSSSGSAGSSKSDLSGLARGSRGKAA